MCDFNKIVIRFDARRNAPAVCVETRSAPERALGMLDLPPYTGMIVIHGGAAKMNPAAVDSVRQFMASTLAPLAEQRRIAVIDGGTHIGVPRASGDARHDIHGTYPLLGVCPQRFVSYPGGPTPSEDRTPLDPSHSHFIFVDGDAFGTETDLMVGLLETSGKPGAALIINGGDLVFEEARKHALRGHTVIALNGSGRIADRLADPHDPKRADLPPGTHLEVAHMNDPAGFIRLLNHVLDKKSVSSF